MGTAQNGSKRYRFLMGLTSKYDSETRAFVLQSYTLERRLRAQERKKHRLASAFRAVDAGAIPDQSHPRVEQPKEGGDKAIWFPYLSISNLLGQGRVDPFRSIAEDLNPFEQRLLDHYAQGEHPIFGHQHYPGFNPSKNIILPWSIRDKACVFATLAYTASILEWQGVLPPFVHSSKYRALTCNAIHARLQSETGIPSILLVVTVCGAICMNSEAETIGYQPEDSDELPKHIIGLKAMIAAHGGWRATGSHSNMMCWILTWVDICTCGAPSFGLTSFSSHAHSSPSQLSTSRSLSLPMRHLYTEELIGAYGDFHRRALASWATESASQSAPCARNRSPFDFFQTGTPIHSLLVASKGKLVRRIAPILYLNIMSWNLKAYSSDSLDKLFQAYSRRFRSSDIFHRGSLEVLMWALFTDTQANRVANRELSELLVRLLYIEDRLTPLTQEILATTLLAFLQYENQQSDAAKAWWTPEQFRDVVYHDLALVPNGQRVEDP